MAARPMPSHPAFALADEHVSGLDYISVLRGGTMKHRSLLCALCLWVCAGCSPKPTVADVEGILGENIPGALRSVAALRGTQTDITAIADGSSVKFKSQLVLTQPLYEIKSFEEAARHSNSDLAAYEQLKRKAFELSGDLRNRFSSQIAATTVRPVFLAEATSAGTSGEWYGSFQAKKVVDRWLPTEFKTDVQPTFKGQARAALPQGAIELSTSADWFSKARAVQTELLASIEVAQKLEQKDADIAAARATAEQERESKNEVLAAQRNQARQLPLRIGFRNALVGGTAVLVVQGRDSMTVTLEVTRGLQHFTKALQLAPGKTVAVGHLEGWGFRAGDSLTFHHPSFDPLSTTVP